jgi:transposase
LAVWEKVTTFAAVFISKIPKYRERPDGTIERYDYFRLSENRRDAEGKVRKRTVVSLGELSGYTKAGRKELGALLEEMITTGSCRMSEDASVYDDAVKFYAHWCDLHPKSSSAVAPDSSLEQALESRRRDIVTICLDKLTNHEPRVIGPEVICRSTASRLGLMEFLLSNGFDRQEAGLAVMQVIARAIYPYSEYRTVKYLRENTALAEMFHIPKEKLTKDALYRSALRLWDVHRRIEDWLHERVTSMFHLEEKILLLDITNTYMEGRMEGSKLCRFGRSKEKRSDCRLVVLAAVVNTEGLIVRTMIYEGNRQDVTTLQEVVGTLSATTSQDARKIVVMDAGFYSADNVKWLTDNGFDYITVLPSGSAKFTADSDRVVRHEDSSHQEIRLQMGRVETDGGQHRALLVDSDAKALKEQSMHEQACSRYEQGLEAIKAGLAKKNGTKSRDAVNNRLGRLDRQYGAVRREYEVGFTYEGSGKKEKTVSMQWKRKDEYVAEKKKFHGKYVLLTSVDENDEVNVWKFYNVIRTVEETFHTLKSDLDMRPVYHKSDDGIKAHLNLAVLAYWIVSVTMYRLKKKGYPNVRWEEIRRIAGAQVMVTTRMETVKGETIEIRQATEEEQELATIYSLLDITPHPLGTRKFVGPPKIPPEKIQR